MTRREWLALAGQAALASVLPADARTGDARQRIAGVIRDYERQGEHRTGTDTDRKSGDWLVSQVHRAGLAPARENFALDRVDPLAATLAAGGRTIQGLPLFDGGFTSAEGVRGHLGALNSGAPIAITEGTPNSAGAGALGAARRGVRHAAIVLVTRGGRPGLCPNNAQDFLRPFGPPVLQVASEESATLQELARQGEEAVLVAHAKRTPATAFNVVATVRGAKSGSQPLVVMTPRSGWWSCASERGGGIACWLEMMTAIHGARPACDVIFVASTGHEVGYRGIEVFAERRPKLIREAKAWIHLGANIGAAQNPGFVLQASDDEIDARMSEALASVALRPNQHVPRGNVPGGEAGIVHRGGGRYVSIIGTNALFHNPADRGPEAVDLDAVARFARALSALAMSLAS